MPPLEWEDLRQDAILWAYDGLTFDDESERVLETPVQIRVRWEWGNKQGKDAKGNNVSIDAEIVVDQEVKVGSILWQGLLENWNTVGSGTVNNGLVEVTYCKHIPDDKGRSTRRTLGCTKWRDTLPTVS